MNDKNFDSLKNLQTPDAWIENALNIPKAQTQEKKPIFFIKYSRQLMAVACLVLVCTVSLFVVLNQGDGSVLVVDPDFETVNTDNTNNENKTQTDSLSDNEDNNKTHNNKPTLVTDNINGGAPSEATESTEHSEKPTQPHDGDSQKPTNKPVVAPTKPTNMPQSTTAPIVKPTAPTDAYTPTEDWGYDESGDPGRPGSPGKPPEAPPQYLEFACMVDTSFLTSGEKVLLAIESPSGKEIIADVEGRVYPYGSRAFAYFSVDSSLFTQSGTYYCHYYSSAGYYISSEAYKFH